MKNEYTLAEQIVLQITRFSIKDLVPTEEMPGGRYIIEDCGDDIFQHGPFATFQDAETEMFERQVKSTNDLLAPPPTT